MRLFNRLDRDIDYNNHYTIKKALGIMEYELNRAMRAKNTIQAREVLYAATQIHEKLTSTYRESSDYGETMSYLQKVWAKRLRFFIGYVEKELNEKPVSKIILDLINEN